MGEDMLQYLIHRTAAICVTVIVLGLALSCCDDDNPVKPPPNDSDTVDYVAYFADASHPYTYFAYHTATETVDSFILPFKSDSGFAISPDGTMMYLNTGHSLATVGLDSFTIIEEYPIEARGRQLSISPDGSYLSILEKELTILRMADLSVVYHDDGYSFNGIFSADSKAFYCSTFDSTGWIFAHKIILSDPIYADTIYLPDGAVWRVLPNSDETKWFVFIWIWNDIFLFDAYDLVMDSIIYRKSFAPGHGDMELTPDGRNVIFSQPGRLNSDVPAPDYFTIFDVDANDIDRQVSTKGICEQSPYGFSTGELCITPDGRHLISIWAIGGGFLFDFDLKTMTFDTCIFMAHNMYLIGLACQSSP